MKTFNLLFLLHWIAIFVVLLVFIPKMNLLSFDDISEAGLFTLGVLGVIFFIIAHGMFAAYSPKTKTGICLVVLGLVQIACSVFIGIVWSSPNHGEMGLFFAFLYAVAVAVISLPFAIALLIQRSRTKSKPATLY